MKGVNTVALVLQRHHLANCDVLNKCCSGDPENLLAKQRLHQAVTESCDTSYPNQDVKAALLTTETLAM